MDDDGRDPNLAGITLIALVVLVIYGIAAALWWLL
jgi:hypothetical protein